MQQQRIDEQKRQISDRMAQLGLDSKRQQERVLQLQKDIEGAQRLTSTNYIPVSAGNSNLKLERASDT